MIKHLKYQTKQGGASIYVTIFVALIISIVTLSFARLAISELSRSSDTDLNQSAYDSALAGVEDAKIAISNCLKEGHTINECGLISSTNNLDDCNHFLDSKYISRAETAEGAVFIEESKNKSGQEVTSQAYTCVVMNNNLADYLGELNSEYRVRMVPLKAQNPQDLQGLTHVIVSWYDNQQATKRNSNCNGSDCYFYPKDESPVPPVITLSLIQAGEDFTRDSLLSDYRKYGSMTLYPNETQDKIFSIGAGNFQSAVDANGNNDTNKPIAVKCKATDAFACSAQIELPSTTRYGNTTYLVIAMPYDNRSTAFRVEMKKNGSTVNFYDAQIAVDSTGRANDIYRRVESRVDMIDTYFPYPLYALETLATENNQGNIKKGFYVTRNCWFAGEVTSDGTISESLKSCDNSNI